VSASSSEGIDAKENLDEVKTRNAVKDATNSL
jgi:hypothetical protein